MTTISNPCLYCPQLTWHQRVLTLSHTHYWLCSIVKKLTQICYFLPFPISTHFPCLVCLSKSSQSWNNVIFFWCIPWICRCWQSFSSNQQNVQLTAYFLYNFYKFGAYIKKIGTLSDEVYNIFGMCFKSHESIINHPQITQLGWY